MPSMIAEGQSGDDYDFFVFNLGGLVWGGVQFTPWVDAAYQSYRVAAEEIGSSGHFIGTAPPGAYSYQLRKRASTLAASFVVWYGTISSSASSSIDGGSDVIPASIFANTDYTTATGRFFAFSDADWPDMTDGVCQLILAMGDVRVVKDGEITGDSPDQEAIIELTAEDLDIITGLYHWQFVLIPVVGQIIVLEGSVEVSRSLIPAG